MLKHRVMTAIILFPLLLLSILYGDRMLWQILLSACVGLTAFETVRMLVPALEFKIAANKDGLSLEQTQIKFAGWSHWLVFSVLISILTFNFSILASDRLLNLSITSSASILPAMFSIVMLYAVFSARCVELSIIRMLGLVVGVVYACLPWFAVWNLFNYGENGRFLFLLIFVVMGCDTGAYFGGKAFGKRKMSKQLSPNKTWEGLIIGVLSAVGFGLLSNMIFDGTLGTTQFIVLVSLVGAITGVLGDLVESGFKRFSGVKDSGKIFPGHGGFLDRVDAILFSAPVVWFCLFLAT